MKGGWASGRSLLFKAVTDQPTQPLTRSLNDCGTTTTHIHPLRTAPTVRTPTLFGGEDWSWPVSPERGELAAGLTAEKGTMGARKGSGLAPGLEASSGILSFALTGLTVSAPRLRPQPRAGPGGVPREADSPRQGWSLHYAMPCEREGHQSWSVIFNFTRNSNWLFEICF